MLQALNILENIDLKSMGYNTARYIHALYQAMNLSFADRDFYYGDPYVPPVEPIEGLLSKAYAETTSRTDQLAAERCRYQTRRSLSVPGRQEPLSRAAEEMDAHSADAPRQKARTAFSRPA